MSPHIIPSLRDYQRTLVRSLSSAYSTCVAPLAVLPTGGGKTVVFSFIIHQMLKAGKTAWVIVHRSELVDQTSKTLHAFGIDHGIISSKHPDRFDPTKPVQVVMVQTAIARLDQTGFPFLPPDYLILDEAHHANSESWRKLILWSERSRLMGFTATPCRLDGKGLGDVFDQMIQGPTTADLIAGGFLCRYRYYAPSQPDMTGVRKVAGDFSVKGTAEAVVKSRIVGDAVAHYTKLAPYSRAIAFVPNVAVAHETAAEFQAAGYVAEVLTGDTSREDRQSMISRLDAGELHVLISVDVISEGFDVPKVETCILLRPTASTALFLQQVGRCLRLADGKDYALILDHAGNVFRHGLPDSVREWSLEGGIKKSKKPSDTLSIRQCPQCLMFSLPSEICPHCGHQHETKIKKLEHVAGDLVEFNKEAAKLAAEEKRQNDRDEERAARSYDDFLMIEKSRGYKHGWARKRWEIRNRKKSLSFC